MSLVGPFHQAAARALEVFVQPRLKEFLGGRKPIKIEVIRGDPGIRVGFDQRIGGALDLAGVTQAPQDAPGQGGLARTQIAFKIDDQPRCEALGENFSAIKRRELVGKVYRFVPAIIMSGMNVKHNDLSADGLDVNSLARRLKEWGRELGFDEICVTDIDLSGVEAGLQAWLEAGYHGQMDYMYKHGTKRFRPDELLPGTRRVITARMSYLSEGRDPQEVLSDGRLAYVSRYALGRDYHKVLRSRLQQLADRISAETAHVYRVFVDSAPVMEVALAEKSGLGWRGKHTLLLSRKAGSFFFLGEIYTDLPLPIDPGIPAHCGKCSSCIDFCPTGAIVAPYQVDARRCISYLTIEHKGAIPVEFRKPMGNRVYGCDDCQIKCPWNNFAQPSQLSDFVPRHGLDGAELVKLFQWTESEFKDRMAGSPIYRIGYEAWLRNLAVALGNAPASPEVLGALNSRRDDASSLVRDHVAWALDQHSS